MTPLEADTNKQRDHPSNIDEDIRVVEEQVQFWLFTSLTRTLAWRSVAINIHGLTPGTLGLPCALTPSYSSQAQGIWPPFLFHLSRP